MTNGAVLCHLWYTQANSAWPLPRQVQDLFLCQEEGSVTRDREEWKQVTARNCKRNPSLPSQLPLQNRYEVLGMVDKARAEIEEEEPMQVLSPKSDQLTPCKKSRIKTSAEKKQQ